MNNSNDIEIESQLDSFCEQVREQQTLWLLSAPDGGVASVTSAYDDNKDVLLLWYSEALAQQQCVNEWQDYTAIDISLSEYFDELAPALHDDGVWVGVNWAEGACSELSAQSLVNALTD